MEFSSNLSAIYTKWCAQIFPTIFGLFASFDRNFSWRHLAMEIIAPPSDGNKNCLTTLKGQSHLKNG